MDKNDRDPIPGQHLFNQQYATEATPTDANLVHAINTAHGLGLNVMLKPHVDLENDPSHCRGQIGESFSDTQWDAWFVS